MCSTSSSRVYTLLLESRPDVVSDNVLTVPAAAAGEITVGSANLQRFFDATVDLGVSAATRRSSTTFW